jgi:hypothetical protein
VTQDARIEVTHIAKCWKIDLGNLVRAVSAVRLESTLLCFEGQSGTSGVDFTTFMSLENDSNENWRLHDHRFNTKDSAQDGVGGQ